MAGLQRSAVSFRRQGSSGLVWDDKFLSGELKKLNQNENNDHPQQDHHRKSSTSSSSEVKDLKVAVGSSNTIQRSRSHGGGYRTGKVSPDIEPPSPKLSACGFCGAFGKSGGDKGQRRTQRRR